MSVFQAAGKQDRRREEYAVVVFFLIKGKTQKCYVYYGYSIIPINFFIPQLKK